VLLPGFSQLNQSFNHEFNKRLSNRNHTIEIYNGNCKRHHGIKSLSIQTSICRRVSVSKPQRKDDLLEAVHIKIYTYSVECLIVRSVSSRTTSVSSQCHICLPQSDADRPPS